MGVRRFLALWVPPAQAVDFYRVIHAGEPGESISVVHLDGSVSAVRVSLDHDALDVQIDSAYLHCPHLRGGYL